MRNCLIYIVLLIMGISNIPAVELTGPGRLTARQISYKQQQKYDEALKAINIRLESNVKTINCTVLLDAINSALVKKGYKFQLAIAFNPYPSDWWKDMDIKNFKDYKNLNPGEIKTKLEAMNGYDLLSEVRDLYAIEGIFYFEDRIILSPDVIHLEENHTDNKGASKLRP
jgi:hypothetical protein